MDKPLDKTIDNFMNVTAKSSVAVIVPLYGFWNDIPNNPVNGSVLAYTLPRLYSNLHHLYVIFVADPKSLPADPKDPNSVANILMGWSKRGNVGTVPVDRNASYTDYIAEGMDYALTETQAQFVVVFNPWVMIQDGAIDVLIDRANRSDDAKVVSGYDLRSVIEPETLDQYKQTMPKEEWDLKFNFLCMPRYIAEMIAIDPNYRTHAFLERDMWQQVAIKSFVVIASERVPVYAFDFPWKDYETREQFQADEQYFTSKWQFNPGIIYEDSQGAKRRDKQGNR